MSESDGDFGVIASFEESERVRIGKVRRILYFVWTGSILLGCSIGLFICVLWIGNSRFGEFLLLWSICGFIISTVLLIIGAIFRCMVEDHLMDPHSSEGDERR